VKRLVAIALLLPLVATAAEEPASARAARFYAAGLETPLLELRRGAMLLQACTTRMRRACSKEQRQLATGNRTLTLLDELTLFPQRPTDDAAAKNAGELKQQIAAAGAALMRAASDYDVALIARYGAALRVCPDDSETNYREPLDALTSVVLRQFQGLGDADYERARQALADAESRATETLRALPAAECDAVLTLGLLLMEMMNGKLEPWTHENQRMAVADPRFDFDAARKPAAPTSAAEAPTRDLAISVAGNFVTLVATELQLRVFPDTAPRIKAIAAAEGIGPG
jgi:hypothetical protein